MIPGTVIPEQIVENMKATEIVLDNDDITRLSGINKDLRFINVCKNNKYYASLLIISFH